MREVTVGTYGAYEPVAERLFGVDTRGVPPKVHTQRVFRDVCPVGVFQNAFCVHFGRHPPSIDPIGGAESISARVFS